MESGVLACSRGRWLSLRCRVRILDRIPIPISPTKLPPRRTLLPVPVPQDPESYNTHPYRLQAQDKLGFVERMPSH